MTKEELIDKYRDINTDYGWWGCTESDLKDDLAEQGFTMTAMYFSGFCSQGDGACFTGHMSDWKKFCGKVPQFVADFPNTAIFLQDEGGNYTITHTGRYYHQYSTSHEYEADVESEVENLDEHEDDDHEADMRLAIYKAAMEEGDVGDWLKDYFRGLMHELYTNLDREYEYQTSDEAVWETIQANELDSELEKDDADEVDGYTARAA